MGGFTDFETAIISDHETQISTGAKDATRTHSARVRTWDRIKTRQPGAPIFRRQYAFGPYILDFYCLQAKLAIEVDGQHHRFEQEIVRDAKRDAWLTSEGIFVYRIPASEVLKDVGSVADGIYDLAFER